MFGLPSESWAKRWQKEYQRHFKSENPLGYIIAKCQRPSLLAAKEVSFLRILEKNDNIVRLFDTEWNGERVLMILESLVRGDLDDNLQERSTKSALRKVELMLKMSRAISQVHQQLIADLDIKPANFVCLRTPITTS